MKKYYEEIEVFVFFINTIVSVFHEVHRPAQDQ